MRKNNGFTLIEVMIVVAIAAILLAIGVPSMSKMILSSRLKTAANDLSYTIALARSEAVKRRTDVHVSGKNNSWSQGFVIFIDKNGNNRYDTSDKMLKKTAINASGLNIRRVYLRNNHAFIKFSGKSGATGGQYMFLVCDNPDKVDKGRERVVQVSITGRTKVRAPSSNHQCSGNS